MPPAFPTLTGWEDAFHEILSYLKPSQYFVFDDKEEVATRFFLRRTLLSLAVSCRAFFDPALDILWYSLDNIHPLLKLLPTYQRHDSVYYLEGGISPEAWSRLRTYAARVRGVTFSRKAGIDTSVWRIILEQCQGTPLLPNLRKFHTIKLNASHLFALRAFASPSLRGVYLEFYEDLRGEENPHTVAPIAGFALQEYSIKAPEITSLCVFPDLAISREHLTCLSRFTHLEELYLKDHLTFDEDLLLLLVNLRDLTHMKLSVLLRDSTTYGPLDLTQGFQKLTRLTLGGQPAHLARFMLACSMPRLNDLSLLPGSRPADGLDTSLASICRHIGPHTLTRFETQVENFVRPPRFLMTFLQPLLPFSKLEEVVFYVKALPLHDMDFFRIARAWPKLRMLRLKESPITISDPDREPGSVVRPTIHALVELARHCPRLTCLCIPELDASVLPLVDCVPRLGHGPLDLCIQNLVGAEDEETQFVIAAVLDRLFPRLDLEYGIEELRGYGGNVNPFLEDSENISLLLRAMQQGREHYPRGVERLDELEPL
ncbi:hypothetical protein GSI_04867 [Ganoderma sinense ZZ0214-1]|uniref:F-box domain-containing protein n=1 Tax=Ganoderma sinense ZZ0214-1 TaxID=1077348 RepID=A0A2G8SG75_9APHY|nr:hypothetical protein GSI_04867 [Ganoderma sinense ZZ0214-1]